MKRSILTALILPGLAACMTPPEKLPFDIVAVPALLETDPIISRGDRADDPAIWIDPDHAVPALILGTDKDEGLYVYDLSGNKVQFLDVGRVNNVDIRGRIAVASNDEAEALSWFSVGGGKPALVEHIGDTPVGKFEPYGVCLGEDSDGLVAAATYKDGTVQIWRANFAKGRPSVGLERTVKLGSKLEGCAFDDFYRTLFIGEEAMGIWALAYSDSKAKPLIVDRIADQNGLVMDVEGISLWEGKDGEGFLVASAQAADRFVVYDRSAPYAPRGIFTVTASPDGSVDAVTHTDGLDVTSAPLPGFPKGLLVVQDDANPESERDQNFKLVDWMEVATSLSLED